MSAQEDRPAWPAASLVLARDIVGVGTGKVAWRVPGSAHVRAARPVAPDLFVVDDSLVDLATRSMLRVEGTDLVLRELGGGVVWRRARKSVGLAEKAGPEHVHIAGDAVVVSRQGGGLHVLERATGARRWEAEGGPNRVVHVERGLVVAAGPQEKGHDLVARALRNGAKAFAASLPGAVRDVAVGPKAVAVACAGHLKVFDRFGPELFAVAEAFDQVIAGDGGFVALRGDEVSVFDLDGKRRWRSRGEPPKFLDRRRVELTPSGDVVLIASHFMSDSGVHCQLLAARDGEVRWASMVPGLGVPHSKYWHDSYVRVRGTQIDVVSQATGGAFFVVLDAADGKVQARHVFK